MYIFSQITGKEWVKVDKIYLANMGRIIPIKNIFFKSCVTHQFFYLRLHNFLDDKQSWVPLLPKLHSTLGSHPSNWKK